MNNCEFVVYFTIYTGKLLPPFYIGSTFYDNIKKGYNGSVESKKWKKIYFNEQRNNPDKFITIILEFCKTRKEALERELYYQIQNNVVENKSFFNESFACVNGFFGNRNIASLNAKGNKNVNGRIWVNNGVVSKMVYPEHIPDGFVVGRCQYDIEQCKKTKRGKNVNMWVTHLTTNESKRIKVTDEIPDGYRKGRKKRNYK